MSRCQRVRETHDRIQQELARERCAALARVAGRLEDALQRLMAARRALDGLHGAERARQLAICRELREHVRRSRWELEVQRESIGLRRHQILDELYPLPEGIEA
jgi:hypothetical protein